MMSQILIGLLSLAESVRIHFVLVYVSLPLPLQYLKHMWNNDKYFI